MDNNLQISTMLAEQFKISQNYTDNIISLINDGNTIPFIARYRKEMTGNMDDQILRDFADRLTYLTNLFKRKDEVKSSISEQEKLTDEIEKQLELAKTITEVEDIYRPFRPKKKTRASVAIEKGLKPLADIILLQELDNISLEAEAHKYINEEKGVANTKDAIAGAQDIIAEIISENSVLRKKLRDIYRFNGLVLVKGFDTSKENAHTFEMYKSFSQEVSKIPPHRILALNRGETEEVLKIKLELNRDLAVRIVSAAYLKTNKSNACTEIIASACCDSFDRLINPSIEREIRTELTDSASEQAIKMFEVNLKPLLLQPPVKGKVTLGLDPAYRTGCKIAVVDETGKVLSTTVIYPTPPQSKIEESKKTINDLITKYNIDVISIGNGTASKEAEIFVAELIKEAPRKVSYMVVNEAGASVYSASKLAAEEFPNFDVSLRSAVSIARRLQDPLAELIKIDPKSIGVGQYQHDMPQARLNQVLTGVLEDCVNSVGVDLNTASVSLLTYVSGLNSGIAKNIVKYRDEFGEFKSRTELLKVSKLGPKAFTQCAGFLRVPDGNDILDRTAVHPESYEAAKKILKNFGYTADDVKNNKLEQLKDQIAKYGKEKLANECEIGLPTLLDITQELLKPGRDLRDSLPAPILRSDIMDLNDLVPGMELTGTVRNVTDFGAFVDIAVHQDGLVHISEISDTFIKKPSDVLTVGDVVNVKVLSVDKQKKRIALTIKGAKQKK